MLKFEIEQLKFVMKENLNWLKVNQLIGTKSCLYYVFMQESPPKLESHQKYHGLHEYWQTTFTKPILFIILLKKVQLKGLLNV
jgi:hypothetical protein